MKHDFYHFSLKIRQYIEKKDENIHKERSTGIHYFFYIMDDRQIKVGSQHTLLNIKKFSTYV